MKGRNKFMKKIIPFKKDILFRTNLSEITSISLEHTLKSSKNSVYGELIVSGEYKINPTSTSVEPFSYPLPFNIDFSDEYDLLKANVEVDDFYYEIVNNDTLSVNIDILIDNIEQELVPKIDIEEKKIERHNILNVEEDKSEKIEVCEEDEKRCIDEEDIPTSINSIFDTLDDTRENYTTYSVYIVRQGDTLEDIITKYNTTKEKLEEYNDLTQMKVNMKIIIPNIDESN